jgi:ABC-type transport system involved in cytochrome bd biosynthesis fused ATPase/permease subunit
LAEEHVRELLRRYLGISAPRVVIGVLMLVFGMLILVKPELLAVLVAAYLIVSGLLVLVDESLKGRALRR